MDYEHKKHDGMLPMIGVNTFLCVPIIGCHGDEIATEIELIRYIEEERGTQIANVKTYGEARNGLVPESLHTLQNMARGRKSV